MHPLEDSAALVLDGPALAARMAHDGYLDVTDGTLWASAKRDRAARLLAALAAGTSSRSP